MQKKLPLVIVTWKDHTSNDAWFDDGEEAEYTVLHTITSVGWVKEETDEKIVLVGAVDKDRHGYSAIQTIGKGLVVSTKVIKEPRPRKKKAPANEPAPGHLLP